MTKATDVLGKPEGSFAVCQALGLLAKSKDFSYFGLVFLMIGDGSSADKANSELPVTKWICSTKKKKKKEVIHTSVQSENILHSWKC